MKKRQDATEPTPSTNSSQKSPRKRQLWANRYRRLKDWVNSLPPLLILRAEKLIQVFLRRKSLHLRLADNYLIKLWGNISRATVQRTLQQLEKLGLLKRITGPPKRQGDGSWKQDRKLILLLPKKDPSEHSYLVSHSGQQPELQGNPVGKNSTQSVKQKPFVDYLYDQQRVSKGAWAYFLRTQGAEPFGYFFWLASTGCFSSIHAEDPASTGCFREHQNKDSDAEAQKLRDFEKA